MIISIDVTGKVVNNIKINTRDGIVVEIHETNKASKAGGCTNITVTNNVATYRVERNRLTHVLPEGHIVEATHA